MPQVSLQSPTIQFDQLQALPVVAGATGAPVVGPPAAGPVVAAAAPVVAPAVAPAVVAAAVVVVVVVEVVKHTAAVPGGVAGQGVGDAHVASQDNSPGLLVSTYFVSSAKDVAGVPVSKNQKFPAVGAATFPQISFNVVGLA